ncbi:MAG: hypothetical protein RQ729_09410, partial [Wenzhouxiangellaceae bacterium]|nr:hypothetical protein [Wenzhouxiangellaceae bacterium]
MIRGIEPRSDRMPGILLRMVFGIALAFGAPALALAQLTPTFTGPATYTAGESATWTITVVNTSTSPSGTFTINTSFPEGATVTAASCSTQGAGSDCKETISDGELAGIDNVVAAANGSNNGSISIELIVAIDSDVALDPLGATATFAGDAFSSAVMETVESTPNPVVDLGVAIAKAALPATYVPGRAGQALSVALSNTGPSDAFGANFSLVWPDPVAGVSWSCAPAAACTPASGSSDATFAVDIVAGGSVTLNAALDFDSGARADLVLEPAIARAVGQNDGSADNDSDSVTLTAERRADIQVTKTASVDSASPGGAFTYDVRIQNLGPSDLGPDPDDPNTFEEIGLLLTDVFPDQLLGDLQCDDAEQPCWRVCASDQGIAGDYGPSTTDAGALTVCPTEGAIIGGSGDITNLPIALAAGSATTLRAFVRVRETGSGELENTASVRLDDGPDAQVVEDTPGGGTDSSPVITPIELATDIRVTKTDNTARAIAGEQHSYTIDVANTGFINATNVSVRDALPLFDPATPGTPGFIPGSISWQCSAIGGACCNTNSSVCGIDSPTPALAGDILNGAVDLPGLSQLRFTVTGTLDPRSTGVLENTASIELPASLQDPNENNNSATDADTSVQAQADLRLDKTLTSLTSVGGDDLPPFELVYRIEITNQGPSLATDAAVTDLLTASVFEGTRVEASWSCSVLDNPGQTACDSAEGAGPLNGANNDAVIDIDPGGRVAFELKVRTSDDAAGSVDNTARVIADAGSASDTVSTSLRGTTRLAITTTDNRNQIGPGDAIDYTVRIENEGPDDAFGARVSDIFPPVVDSLTWSCEATTPIPGDLAELGLAGAANTAADALVTSPDGRHVYAVGTSSDSLFAFDRNSVPGAGFGRVAGLETEINGIDDTGDAGGAVSAMERPLDLAISPDGLGVYVLAQPEATVVQGFFGQYAPPKWAAFTQSFPCGTLIGTSTVTAG